MWVAKGKHRKGGKVEEMREGERESKWRRKSKSLRGRNEKGIKEEEDYCVVFGRSEGTRRGRKMEKSS